MSVAISCKVDAEIHNNTQRILKNMASFGQKKSRNAYINEALDMMNRMKERELRKQQFEKESKIIAAESMSILQEFEQLPDDYE